MKKIFAAAALLLSLMGTPALAQDQSTKTIDCANVDITKLDDRQIATTREACKTTAVQEVQAAAATVTPEKVREWGSLGRDFGQAITETAKGLGVAVNEFLFTPVGFLIALYFMWDLIGGILIGIPLLFCIWWLYVFICKKVCTSDVEYTYVPVLWGLFSIKRIKSESSTVSDSDRACTWVLMAIPALIVTAIDIGGIIF